MTILIYVAVVAVLALIPAYLAKQRGIGAVNYWVLGVLIWPAAMLIVLLNKRPRCPHCRHPVPPDASVCGSCSRELSAPPSTVST